MPKYNICNAIYCLASTKIKIGNESKCKCYKLRDVAYKPKLFSNDVKTKTFEQKEGVV